MKLEILPQLSCFDRKRGLILPKETSEDLAEFLGIIFGDGFSNRYKRKGRNSWDYEFSISGDYRDDVLYHKKHVIPLIKKLFHIMPKHRKIKDQNTICVDIKSRGIYYFLKDLGFSNPKNNIRIPKWIFGKEEYLIAFIRGFADTDFSLSFRARKIKCGYPRITTCIRDEELAKDLIISLKKLNFRINYQLNIIRYDKRGFTNLINNIDINGHKNFMQWMKSIGFRNPKHITKFLVWDKYGFCKPYTSLKDRIKLIG